MQKHPCLIPFESHQLALLQKTGYNFFYTYIVFPWTCFLPFLYFAQERGYFNLFSDWKIMVADRSRWDFSVCQHWPWHASVYISGKVHCVFCILSLGTFPLLYNFFVCCRSISLTVRMVRRLRKSQGCRRWNFAQYKCISCTGECRLSCLCSPSLNWKDWVSV